MDFLLLHVFNSSSRVLVPIAAISQLSDFGDHAAVTRVDGGTVEVVETFDQVFANMKAPSQ